MHRVARALYDELGSVDARVLLANLLLAPLPAGVGTRLRARVLRLVGLQVGVGTLIISPFTLQGGPRASRNLTIGRGCFINGGCVFDATASIEIGAQVSLGEGVLITTSSHEVGHRTRRAGALSTKPVRIGDGAWLASRVTVLPGVTIGAGAVVSAGAVVTRDVAPNTLVAGVPAREVRALD